MQNKTVLIFTKKKAGRTDFCQPFNISQKVILAVLCYIAYLMLRIE